MPERSEARRTFWFRLLPLGLAALPGALGCRPEPSQPPDPDEPTPALACDEIPVTLARVEPDSSLDTPSWVEVCTSCPVAEATVVVEDGTGRGLHVEAAWTPLRECVVGLPTEPLPARPSTPASVQLVDPLGRVAVWDFDMPLAEGRGADPVDLDGATWLLPLPDDAYRLLGGPELLPGAPGALLLSLGIADAEARRPLTLASARGDGLQDTCEATATLSTPATLLSRQVALPLVSGDELPGGLVAERGALQARLTEDGSALLDVTLLAVVSLPLSEGVLGLPPDEACAAWEASFGFDPCIPCGPPSEGVAGLPACFPLLIEGARAERVPDSLLAIDAESIAPDCRQTPDIAP